MTAKQLEIFEKAILENITTSNAGIVVTELMKENGVNLSLRTVQRKLAKARKDGHIDFEPPACPPSKTPAFTVASKTSDLQEATLQSEKRVVTVKDVLSKGAVDTNEWCVKDFVLNSWEVGAKGPDGRIRVTPLWQVKVWFKRRDSWSITEFRDIIYKDMRKLAPSYRLPKLPKKREPVLAELSIFDAHFGKLAWAPESGQDYDLDICRTRYLGAARDLLARAARENPDRVLYVVGNDFFHTDHKGTTTSGTPMDVDGRWQKSFRVGKDCAITVAEEAAQFADVDILVVPGNHDREKAFLLGEVLEARFHKCKRINVLNKPDLYSYYRYGNVLLGFVHGDNHTSDRKRRNLPHIMTTDNRADWSNVKWAEWHLGHFHSEQEDVWHYRRVTHIQDMAIRILPSLSSTDAWHREQGYQSVLAAECHLHHKENGRIGYLVHQADPISHA